MVIKLGSKANFRQHKLDIDILNLQSFKLFIKLACALISEGFDGGGNGDGDKGCGGDLGGGDKGGGLIGGEEGSGGEGDGE